MIKGDRATIAGMKLLLEELAQRYVFDAKARIVTSRSDGIPPRFVLARSEEGCLWRFRVDCPSDLVIRVARLAAREAGFPIGGEGPIPPPERLVMIERLFAEIHPENAREVAPRPAIEARRETVTRESVIVAELFEID
jgi:hypothetical protein